MRFSRRALKMFLTGFMRIPSVHKHVRYHNVPEAVIISTGGVGTTMLMEHCNRFITVNSTGDWDGLKHLPNLPHSFPPTVPIIYVYGEPDAVYASIKRRGWLGKQGSKLGCPSCFLTFGGLRKRLFLNAVGRQITAFRDLERPRTLRLHYEQLWDNTQAIADALNIQDPAFVASFPERRARASDVMDD